MPRLRRTLRAMAWTAGGLLALVGGLLCTALLAARTEWGREQVRWRVERYLDAEVQGQMSIGRIESLSASEVVLHDVTLKDEEGRVVLGADELHASVDVGALASRRIALGQATVRGLVVRTNRMDGGELEIARLFRSPGPPGPPGKPWPWTVTVDSLRIEGARVLDEIITGEPATFTGVDAEGAIERTPELLTIDVRRLHAQWEDKGIPVEVTGRTEVSRQTWTVTGATVLAGRSTLRCPELRLDRPGGKLTASLALALQPDDARRLSPALRGLLGDVVVESTVARDSIGAPWTALFAGSVGGSPVRGQATLPAGDSEDQTKHLSLSVEALSPERIWRGAPAGRVSGTLRADVSGASVASIEGNATVRMSGHLAGVHVDTLTADVTSKGGVIRTEAAATTDHGRVILEGRLRLGRELFVEEARLSGQVTDVAAVAPSSGIAGPAHVQATARGPVDSLSVQATVRAARLRSAQGTASEVHLEANLEGVPRVPTGRVSGGAASLVAGNLRFAKVAGTARFGERGRVVDVTVTSGPGGTAAVVGAARIRLSDRSTAIELGELAVTVRTLEWRGHGGTITLPRGGGVIVDRVALASAAGRIEVDGELESHRDPRKNGWLHLRLVDLDLARAQAGLLPRPTGLRGLVSLEARVARRGRSLVANTTARVKGLALEPGGHTLDASVTGELGDGRLKGSGALSVSRGGGKATFALDMAAPREVLDRAAWRLLDPGAIEQVRLSLAGLDLELLQELQVIPVRVAGKVSGNLRWPASGPGVVAELSVQDGRFGRARDLRADIAVTWDRRALDLQARLAHKEAHILTGTGRVELGWDDLRRGGLDALETAPLDLRLDADRVGLDRFYRAGLVDEPVSGRLTLHARVQGTMHAPRGQGQVSVTDATMNGVAFGTLTLDAKYDGKRLDAELHGKQSGGGQVDARLGLPSAASAQVAVEVDARSYDLAFLSAFAAEDSDLLSEMTGRLDAKVSVSGTRARPRAKLSLRLRDGRLVVSGEVRRISELALEAGLDRGNLVLSRLYANTGTGRLLVHGRATLAGFSPRRFDLKISSQKLPVNAGRMLVGLDSQVTLAGRLEGTTWLVRANVDSATIHMPREKTAELQRVGPLEDVTYIDSSTLQVSGRAAPQDEVEPVSSMEPLARIRVVARRGVQIRGPDAAATVRADLDVEILPTGQTSIAGDLDVQRGLVILGGRRYEVRHARATLDGEIPPNPTIDVRLAHEFREMTLYVDVSGTMDKPEVNLSSDPSGYDESRLFSVILGGEPGEAEPSDGKAPRTLESKAVGITSNLVVGQVRQRLQETLPVDVLRLEVGDPGLGETLFEVGKWVSDDILVGYRHRTGAEEDQNVHEAMVEFRFLRRWLLEAWYGDRGVGGADVLWVKRY